MDEVWKPILGWAGWYEVSDGGNVRSTERTISRRPSKAGPTAVLKSRLLHQTRRKRGGYMSVNISRDNIQRTFLVHKLVLDAFVGPCPEGQQCRHINGNPADNRLENLQWGTGSENMRDQRRHGTNVRNRGERNHRAQITEEQVLEIRQLSASGETQAAIGRRFGVTPDTVWNIVHRHTWRHLPG